MAEIIGATMRMEAGTENWLREFNIEVPMSTKKRQKNEGSSTHNKRTVKSAVAGSKPGAIKWTKGRANQPISKIEAKKPIAMTWRIFKASSQALARPWFFRV